MFKTFIQRKLEGYVKKYLKRHQDVKLIVVVGSVGKTSTKIAIGTVLAQKLRVRLHEGNHNAELSAPLAILGINHPNELKSVNEWMRVFWAAKKRIRQPSDVDAIIQEVGTDRVGQVPHFGEYAKPYLAVVTAVAPEHMEYFRTVDAVAAEELAAANYSQYALINRDDIDGKYAADLINPNINTYGTTDAAEYHFIENDYSIEKGFEGSFIAPERPEPIKASVHVMGEHSIRAAVAAMAVGVKFGLSNEEIARGLSAIQPVSGRMQVLRGVNDTLLIDDTYNSSPRAAASALQTLYSLNVPQRIAVLGSMNELGELSAKEHETIGKMCDPVQLAHVVTVGEEAEKYLAPAARSNGCHVVSFKNALEAGAFVHKALEPGAAILFKGSQGGIFLEEAVKVVLHSTDDEEKLVRQSPDWMAIKQQLFEN